jgi:hypothetical protein
MSFVIRILCLQELTQRKYRQKASYWDIQIKKEELPDSIAWKVQIVKLFVIQFSPFINYLFHISFTFHLGTLFSDVFKSINS